MLQHEHFPCVGLFGEVLGRGTALSLPSFIIVYIVGKRGVPAKAVLFAMGLSSHCVVTAWLGDRFWCYDKESEVFFERLEYGSVLKQFKASSWKEYVQGCALLQLFLFLSLPLQPTNADG